MLIILFFMSDIATHLGAAERSAATAEIARR
jgi:hypothetical protein